jgi:hypothetical protein
MMSSCLTLYDVECMMIGEKLLRKFVGVIVG